jgi:hypothetical protein
MGKGGIAMQATPTTRGSLAGSHHSLREIPRSRLGKYPWRRASTGKQDSRRSESKPHGQGIRVERRLCDGEDFVAGGFGLLEVDQDVFSEDIHMS